VLALVRRSQEFGVQADKVGIDWGAAVDRAQGIVKGCADPKPAALESAGIALIAGSARLIEPHLVVVDDRRMRAKSVLIATGAQVPQLPITGIELAETHVEMLALRVLPKRIVLIGGGVIGMEFAFMFARAGSQVVVLELFEHILGRLDSDLRQAVVTMARDLGIEIHTSTRITGIAGLKGNLVAQAESPDGEVRLEADHVVLTPGLVPAIDGLGLEEIGVDNDHQGVITDTALRTSVPHIFAAGDVRKGSLHLSPVASRQGAIASRNALLGEAVTFDDRVIPYLIGLTPPVASVGLSEEEVRAAHDGVEVHRQDYSGVCPVAHVVGEEQGFMKLVVDSRSGEILGGHAIGGGAPELIQQVAFAMLGRLTLKQAAAALFVFPGLSQALQHALSSTPKN
jgi:dihydrolipoamide dehydrogenase